MSELYCPIIIPEFDENNDPACPIKFFKKKRSTSTETPSTEPQPTSEGITPSFCRGPMAEELPRPKEESLPALAPPSLAAASIPYHVPALLLGRGLPNQEQADIKPAQPKEPRAIQPRAYDIAMELMAVQSLRISGNALYAYDGQIYRFVDAPTMNRLIMKWCRPYVHAVGDASIIEKVYRVIQAEPNICIPSVDGVPLVALDDGLFDLTTFTLLPFSPEPFVTVKLNGSFTRGQTAACPTFDAFLTHVTGGDPILTERIWQAIGYAIVPDTNGKCFILFQGVPDSGKSLLGDVIASLVDADLVTSLDIAAMGERFGVSELVGKQLCLALDLPSGTLDSKAASTFKQLTGGDFVTADVKYQPRIRFRCLATFIFATNHALLTRDPDPALLGRAATVPFYFPVDKARQDHTLKGRILTERDAIIYRAIQAYGRLRQANYQFAGAFAPNEAVAEQGEALDNLTDALCGFCRKFCVPAEGEFTPTAALYQVFGDSIGITWPGGIRSFSDEVFRVLCTLFPQQVERDRKRPKGTSKNPERGFAGILLNKSPCA